MTTINSTDDQRVENSPVRHQYRVLSDAEKSQVQTIKDKALDFLTYLDALPIGVALPCLATSEELLFARHYIKQASMLAVAHVTK